MRNRITRYYLYYLVIAAFVISGFIYSCQKKSGPSDLQNKVERIASGWVPDQREGISSITVSEGNGNTVIIKGETDCRELKQEVIDTLTKGGYSVLDSLMVLPSNELGEDIYGVTALSVINLRKNPWHSAELVNQSVMGTPLKVLKDEDSWLLVQTPDRYIAWTEKSSVQLMSASDLKQWRSSPKLIFTDNSGWIYESSQEKAVVGDLVAGCIMKSSGHSAGYEEIILPDGRKGFVRKNSVTEYEAWKSDTSYTGDDVYKAASLMMGLPYMWGGSSTKAVDCSGFVQTAYFQNRIILSRDASLQAMHGLAVDISDGWHELKTGDLLFFGTIRNLKPRITHVALYKGDSEFIHSAGRVMVNSLDSTRANFSRYRKNTLLSARRIIGSVGSPGIVFVNDHELY
jgi:hypothetical protein